MSNTHVMVDLETLAIENPVILSIGAVVFDPFKADQDLSENDRQKKRKEIKGQIAELKFQESALNLAKIEALDENRKLDKLLSDLQDATSKSRDEIEHMRRATKIAQQVSKVANAATKVIGIIAKFLV